MVKFMDELKYIAYYSDPDDEKCRKTAPSADTKIDYILSAVRKIGYDVKVISKCSADRRDKIVKFYGDYTIEKNGTPVRFVPDLTSKFRILRFLARLYNRRKVNGLIKEECLGSDCKILIYHSLGMYPVIRFLKRHKKPFVLEVEEIYSDVMTKGKRRSRKKEDEMFAAADAFVLSTELLNAEVNKNGRPYVVINGTYQSEPERKCIFFEKDLQPNGERKIHCVYAGTFDPRKGGSIAAAAAAAYLPSGYHIHILGFGSETEVKNMQDAIAEIAKEANATVTYDGLLSGEDYIRFIQSCDIGLSTQNPDAAFNATSFPSKILSYMANGLRVVSVRIPAIEGSAVGKYLYYYDRQTPEEIAKAIMAVGMDDGYDGRRIINRLDENFRRDLKTMLGELN